MKLSRRARDGIWMVVARVDGKTHRLSTGVRDREEAGRLAPSLLQKLHNPEPEAPKETKPDDPNVLTLKRCFDRCLKEVWREAKAYKTLQSNVRILEHELGASTPVADVDYDRIMELVSAWRQKGYKEATIKRKLDTLSTALKWATVWKSPRGLPYLASKPVFPRITLRNMRDRYMTLGEEALAFDAIARRRVASGDRTWTTFETLIMFLLDTGCRLSEALGARVEHLEDGRILFPRYSTKTDKPRVVPLSARLRSRIRALVETSPDGGLFDLDRNRVWRMWRMIRDDMPEIDDVNLHILRHTCASRLLQGGIPIHKVSKWLGHTDLSITLKRYAHLAVEDLDDAREVIEESAPHLRVAAQ